MSLVTLNFESEYLNGNTVVNVILPDRPKPQPAGAFYAVKKRYKVLWLLHGTYGDHTDWLRKSQVEIYAREKALIVVMPNGLNSDYADWAECMMGYNMGSFLTKELMPLIHNWFPSSDKREDNYIAGLSMGGRATIKYALAHPEMFAGAASLSGPAPDYATELADPAALEDPRSANRVRMYGGIQALLDSDENSYRMLADAVANKVDLPRLYCAIGTDDHLYPRYQAWKAYAQELGADITFEELDGFAHEWRFWDITIQKALDFFGIPDRDMGQTF